MAAVGDRRDGGQHLPADRRLQVDDPADLADIVLGRDGGFDLGDPSRVGGIGGERRPRR
jgi:hypothetical protein